MAVLLQAHIWKPLPRATKSTGDEWGSGGSRIKKKTRDIANTNARIQKKKKHKVILIGDSHARGCAEKLSGYLGTAYEVTGYVSPNTGLDVITNSAKEEIEQLTQNDIVIVCGGTNNISKNE
jgi:hypothetical protein